MAVFLIAATVTPGIAQGRDICSSKIMGPNTKCDA